MAHESHLTGLLLAFCPKVLEDGGDLQIVLCHSVNACWMVGIPWGGGDTQTLPCAKEFVWTFLYSQAVGTRLSHLCGFLVAFRSILTSRMTSRFERLVARLLFFYQVKVSFSQSIDEHQIWHSWEETSSFQKSNFSPTHFLQKTITFKAKRKFISRRCLLFCCFYTDRVALNTLPINKLASPQKLILYKEISKC